VDFYQDQDDYHDYLNRLFRQIEERLQSHQFKHGKTHPEQPPIPHDRADDLIESGDGQWRSRDLQEYRDFMWSPMAVFLDLIHSKFIDLNTLTGEARQLRSFKTGYDLEKPQIIYPVRKGRYLHLQVEVRDSATTTRIVPVRLHRLVYMLVHGDIPYGREIHHKDGNTENNSISNLEALNPVEHEKVSREAGVYNKPRISRDDPVVEKILQLHRDGLSFREIEKQVGYSYVTCYKIVAGKYRFR
jgi:hypothetical protein